MIAEGIERLDDLRVLSGLGVAFGQGYLLGRPSALPRLEARVSIEGHPAFAPFRNSAKRQM